MIHSFPGCPYASLLHCTNEYTLKHCIWFCLWNCLHQFITHGLAERPNRDREPLENCRVFRIRSSGINSSLLPRPLNDASSTVVSVSKVFRKILAPNSGKYLSDNLEYWIRINLIYVWRMELTSHAHHYPGWDCVEAMPQLRRLVSSFPLRLFGICTHSVFMTGFLRVQRFPLQLLIAPAAPQADHSGRSV